MSRRSHLLAAARFGPRATSELAYAKELWPLIPDQSLLIVDRNFLSAAVLIPLAGHGHERHWLVRAKSDTGGVTQELWGLALAYNLVRLEMERIAEEAGVTPDRISFKSALMYIEHALLTLSLASPGRIPDHLRRLREDVAHFILPKRRQRSYPRAVKIKMSNYPRKRRGHK